MQTYVVEQVMKFPVYRGFDDGEDAIRWWEIEVCYHDENNVLKQTKLTFDTQAEVNAIKKGTKFSI